MSDPSQSTDAEPPREVDEDDYPDVEAEPTDRNAEPVDPVERAAEADAEAEAQAEDDVEDVESEWHVWILGAIVLAGIVLFFAPRFLVPELLGSLGVFLVVIGLLGWIVKWAIERSA